MLNQIGDATPEMTLDTDIHLQRSSQDSKIDDLSSPVNISDIPNLLHALKNSLKESPAINEARVLYFKSEVALGNYQIDCDKIIDKLLNLEQKPSTLEEQIPQDAPARSSHTESTV